MKNENHADKIKTIRIWNIVKRRLLILPIVHWKSKSRQKKKAQLKKNTDATSKTESVIFPALYQPHTSTSTFHDSQNSHTYFSLCNQQKDENIWLEIKIAIVNFSTKWLDLRKTEWKTFLLENYFGKHFNFHWSLVVSQYLFRKMPRF